MSKGSENRENLINEDGYHLSLEGTKLLASNLRKTFDKMLDISRPPLDQAVDKDGVVPRVHAENIKETINSCYIMEH